MLLYRGLGDDELPGDRPGRCWLGERVTREQRSAESQEHITLARREWRRLRDRSGLRPSCRGAELQAKPTEDDLIARMEGALADDPSLR